jgi:hypothetical protein
MPPRDFDVAHPCPLQRFPLDVVTLSCGAADVPAALIFENRDWIAAAVGKEQVAAGSSDCRGFVFLHHAEVDSEHTSMCSCTLARVSLPCQCAFRVISISTPSLSVSGNQRNKRMMIW